MRCARPGGRAARSALEWQAPFPNDRPEKRKPRCCEHRGEEAIIQNEDPMTLDPDPDVMQERGGR